MAVKQRKPMAAFTLIEVMAAILIVTIVIVGCAFLFAIGKGQISLQKHYRVATQLAAQKLEELKAEPNYASIGDSTDNTTLEDILYTRKAHVANAGSYKEVTVTVSWGHASNEPNVSLVTCIAPK
ncbi:MAG: prepilin-type N-terminal cleavage/methylation domain-containing protein [Sedimentisphaerales bacterium]